jgi:hypothetical protein
MDKHKKKKSTNLSLSIEDIQKPTNARYISMVGHRLMEEIKGTSSHVCFLDLSCSCTRTVSMQIARSIMLKTCIHVPTVLERERERVF